MENYIMFEGKKIPLTDEQVKIMLAIDMPKSKSPFERADSYNTYFFINESGIVNEDFDDHCRDDDDLYLIANYCTNKALMIQRALHETLNRLLWRFSVENGELGNPWDGDHAHYELCYCRESKRFVAYPIRNYKVLGNIYFTTNEIAHRAIDEIVKPFMKDHPEFVL